MGTIKEITNGYFGTYTHKTNLTTVESFQTFRFCVQRGFKRCARIDSKPVHGRLLPVTAALADHLSCLVLLRILSLPCMCSFLIVSTVGLLDVGLNAMICCKTAGASKKVVQVTLFTCVYLGTFHSIWKEHTAARLNGLLVVCPVAVI